MSHHHILPPITYTPEPRPKKIETRKRRINVGDAGALDDMDETGETQGATAFGTFSRTESGGITGTVVQKFGATAVASIEFEVKPKAK